MPREPIFKEQHDRSKRKFSSEFLLSRHLLFMSWIDFFKLFIVLIYYGSGPRCVCMRVCACWDRPSGSVDAPSPLNSTDWKHLTSGQNINTIHPNTGGSTHR